MASLSSDEDDLLKHFYQKSKFDLTDTTVSNRQKADTLRSLLFFIDRLLECKKIDSATHEILHNDYSLQYSGLVDSMDSLGLDNYSTMISVLTEGKRNTGKEWVSDIASNEALVNDLMKEGKRETVNMKISLSKKIAPFVDENSKPCKQNFQSVYKKTADFRSQQSFNTRPDVQIPTDTDIPRFGKRKPDNPEFGNQAEKKRQVNDVIYGPKNTSGNRNIANERKKSIIYGRENNNQHLDPEQEKTPRNPFLTAGQQLKVDSKKSGKAYPPSNSLNYGMAKKSLGSKRGVSGKFVPPIGQEKSENKQAFGEKNEPTADSKYEGFEWMKNIDPKMIELIENEIMDHGTQVSWNDIAGLEFAKATIQEIVIWPMLRPDLFTGLRGPPKGLLLFGPPGTGKTLIGKCIASQSNAQFFNISASSLTSKWVGEGEKMVRALFGVARCQQPAVIFIDEIDSLLTQRSESEHESSRRIKTEFLVQLDGATASSEDRLLVVGATNRPQELDEAARRRLVKRLYIPLPDADARKHIVKNLMSNQLNDLSEEDVCNVVSKSSGFSGADMSTLCREAALGPIRGITDIRNINADEVRPVNVKDFLSALKHVRPSVSQNDLQVYVDWNRTYGSGGGL